ncbi:MAG: hypothetical protein A2X86_00965 [Bdellovibrionales bacterium GWA2_49_15]|nr:MAG: hypothetical protein A2X86_00965 [Bdellovibrionales bacterium GWA2_49_15]
MTLSKYLFFLILSGLLHLSVIMISVKLAGVPGDFISPRVRSMSVKLTVPQAPVLNSSRRKIRNNGPRISPPSPEETAPTSSVASGNSGTVQIPITYPELSRQRGEEGVVDLRIAVNQSGLVEEVIILKSSGFRRLDAEAMRAAQKLEGANPGARDFSVRFKLENL